MTLHEFADPSAWLEAMVARWEALGGPALQARGSFSVSLSGGSTPKPLYERLAKLKWPWSATHLYLGDERWVPPDHKDSNYRMIHEAFHATGAKIERVHTEIGTPEIGARDYEKRLKAELGDPPKFDLILLGVGDDGHTSSLFPGTAALKENKLFMAANFVPKLGVSRITSTYHLLRFSRAVWFVTRGPSKEPYIRALTKQDPAADFPAAPAKPKAAASAAAPAPVSGKVLPPFVMVIFGASGDLTSRKLVPALFGLQHEGILAKDYAIIGFARRPKKDDEFRKEMKEGVEKFSRLRPVQTADWDKFTPRLTYHQGNFDDPTAYASLKKTLEELAKTRGLTQHIFYLATAPDYFATVVQQLAKAGLVRPGLPARVVVEKPFGHDLNSARQLVDDLQACLDESNLFRIDHYLGKETVQNLLYFRFANSIWEPIWNSNLIDNVQITVAEQEGVGTRGAFYDEVGAMRDMVQNHMMQLLAITAMEPPANLSSESIRDEKVKVLRSIPTPKPEIIAASTVRAQYEGYRQTDRVSPNTTTETYAALKLQIDNWRWSGVPFYLRTGKALTTRASEIVIVFRRPPATLFRAEFGDLLHRNAMHIRLQPDEGVHLCFNAKRPGKTSVQPVDMEFCYATEFGSYSPEAYERLLGDAIYGDSTLFTRADEVLEAWRLVDAVRNGWQDNPMALYRQGSWGPRESDLMLKADGNNWVDLDARAKA